MQMSTGDQSPVITAGRDVTVNYGGSIEEYEAVQRRLLKEFMGDELKRQVIEARLADLQKSWEEEIRRRMAAEQALIEFKGQLPDEQIKKAVASLQTGDAQKAEEALDAVEEQADKDAARAAFHNGQLAEGRLDYARAMLKYRKAVERDGDNPDYLLAAGIMAWKVADYAKAEEWLKHLLQIKEAAGQCVSAVFALALNELALVYSVQGRYAEAEPLYQRSLEIREKTLGEDHHDVAESLHNLAWLCSAQGCYEEAEPLYERALEILEKTLGKKHPNVAASLSSLALLYHTQGKYAKAEPLYQRSLEIREKTLGEDHHDVAESLHNLARLYHAQGKYAESEPLHERALEISERTLGKDHPHFAFTLNNLADVYQAQGRYAEAEPLYQQCLSILTTKFPDGHPRIDCYQKNYDSLKQKMAEQAK